jgi:hypothetical protein
MYQCDVVTQQCLVYGYICSCCVERLHANNPQMYTITVLAALVVTVLPTLVCLHCTRCMLMLTYNDVQMYIITVLRALIPL